MNKRNEESTKTEEMDEDTICGIGSFRPQWIQKWATEKAYFVLFSLVGIVQGSHYTYFIGTITTLEKRFAFNSKISTRIMLADEFSPLVLGILIGYFGGKMHRPRVIATGMFMSIGCCLLSALPYFIYGPAKHLVSITVKNETGPEFCASELKIEHCDIDDRPPTVAAITFFCMAILLKGFGSVAYLTAGLSYMDDNTKKKDTPAYFDDPGFDPDDPRWIGGWWIGFVFEAVLLFIFSFPLFLFPRRLPNHPKPKVISNTTRTDLLSQFSDLYSASKRLMKNPIFILLVVNICASAFGTGGHFTFLPKYMENQFRMSASDANMYSEPAGIAAVMISTAIGGILIRKYRPKAKHLIAGMAISEAVAAAGYLLLMIPQCERVEMSNFGFDKESLILTNDCNVNCNCTTSAFYPICGPDGRTTYFSPCYAGCREKQSIFHTPLGEKEIFENCACIANPSVNQKASSTKGKCADDNCLSQAIVYVVIFPILQAITNILRAAYLIILFRSVHPGDKSVALGFFDGLLSLFGIIPHLLISGAVVDSMCLIWERSCGGTGNCWFYDMEMFNYILHGSSAFFTTVGSFSLFAVCFLHQRLQSLYDEEEDATENKENEVELKAGVSQE